MLENGRISDWKINGGSLHDLDGAAVFGTFLDDE